MRKNRAVFGLPFPLCGERKGKNMNRTFTINNKLYKAKAFDFNLLCDLEEQGLSLDDIEKKPMSLIRTYIAFCGNVTKEIAGREIEAHFIGGGNFDDVSKVLASEMEDSGFFRALRENTAESARETSTKSAKSKKE